MAEDKDEGKKKKKLRPKKVVEKLLEELGLPANTPMDIKGNFENMTLLLAILKTDGSKVEEVISSLTIDLSDSDYVNQRIDPNGDYILTVRIRQLKGANDESTDQ